MTRQMHLRPSLALIRKFAPLALVLVSALVVVAAYFQALNFPFNSDDNFYVAKNSRLAALHLTELWRLFIEPYNPVEFLPLRDLSYWFDIALFGLNPAAFRIHNVVLYLLCLPLVYSVTSSLWRYFRPADAASAPWAAAVVTALFTLHPAHVEAVVWISGRKDVLAALFSLLALWFAARARRAQSLSAPHAAMALLMLLAAMFSKATAVAVVPVIAMLWIVFWRDMPVSNRHRLVLLWPLASVLLAAFTTLFFAAHSAIKVPAFFGVETITRALAVLGWMARIAVSPESRHFFYPVLEYPYLAAMVAIGALVLAAALAGIAMMLRKHTLEGFALLAFFLLCLPYMQLAPYLAPSLVADRWLAVAVWPVILLVVAVAWRLKPVLRMVLLLVIALSWGWQTLVRPNDWRSFEAITAIDSQAYPGYSIPVMHRIVNDQLPRGLLREAGESASRITDPEFRALMFKFISVGEAIHVDAIATSKPDAAMALLWQLGQDLKQTPAQAKWNPTVLTFWQYCQTRLTLEWEFLAEHFPEDASVRYNAGLWLLNVDEYKEAADNFSAAIASQRLPESARGAAYKNLGLALANSGHIAAAEAPLRAALAQTPADLRAYCLLEEVYKQSGRSEEAKRARVACTNRETSK